MEYSEIQDGHLVEIIWGHESEDRCTFGIKNYSKRVTYLTIEYRKDGKWCQIEVQHDESFDNDFLKNALIIDHGKWCEDDTWQI
jgi:hypothetical protein